MDITITKNHNGSLTLSTIHDGYRVFKTYYSYSKNEALALFKQYLKGG